MKATVPKGPCPAPPHLTAASRGSHPVDLELPDDDRGAKGAGRVHGAAGEVDLSGRVQVQGVRRLRAGPGGDSPLCPGLEPWSQPWPLRRRIPDLDCGNTASTQRMRGLGRDPSWPSGSLQPPQGETSLCMYTVSPWPLTPMRWPGAREIPIMVAGEPDAWRLSVETKTQSTSCRVRTSSTATAWPVETLLRTWVQRLGCR